MQHLDRALQRQILEHLRSLYPKWTVQLGVQAFAKGCPDFWANVEYLGEHGLIEGHPPEPATRSPQQRTWKITKDGLDFLEDDGGLGAILGVVTVKLHADTVRDLLAKRIEAAPVAPEQKAAWLEKLKWLPAQAAERIVVRLAEAGADRGWDFLRRVLEQSL